MIDFHSHILPGMDDGSQKVEESLQMLAAQAKQGIDTVVATSHFYADRSSPRRFVEKRSRAWEALREELPQNTPEILLGAEVLYFPGISRAKGMGLLCTEGTNILLLEMPFIRWPETMVREVRDLAHSGRYTLMMAHIERYYFLQDQSVWDELNDDGIWMQSNAEFFLSFRTKRKALKLLWEDRIHLLGTDCHNMDKRRPRMDEAMAVIRKRLGDELVSEIDARGRKLLKEAAV